MVRTKQSIAGSVISALSNPVSSIASAGTSRVAIEESRRHRLHDNGSSRGNRPRPILEASAAPLPPLAHAVIPLLQAAVAQQKIPANQAIQSKADRAFRGLLAAKGGHDEVSKGLGCAQRVFERRRFYDSQIPAFPRCFLSRRNFAPPSTYLIPRP